MGNSDRNCMGTIGALRICLDPPEFNKAIRRGHQAIPTPGEIVAKLHGSKYFSTLDATSGFLQIPLDDASSYLTTFATPSGRYRFLRLPFDIKSATEIFHRTIVELFHDVEGVETYIYDIDFDQCRRDVEKTCDSTKTSVLSRHRNCSIWVTSPKVRVSTLIQLKLLV